MSKGAHLLSYQLNVRFDGLNNAHSVDKMKCVPPFEIKKDIVQVLVMKHPLAS